MYVQQITAVRKSSLLDYTLSIFPLVIFPDCVVDMLDPDRDQETDTDIRHFL